MNTRTVLIDTQLDGHASLAALYDPAVYQVAYFDGAANGHVQIQDYLTAHQIDLSTINVVTASDSTSGLFNARVVFVDPGVADHQSLIAQLPADATVVVLDAHSDGVQQIRDFLAHNEGLVTAVDIITDVATVDLISHGGAGEVTLGSTVLSAGNLAAYQDVLADIGSHLADGADILIYGCDVASGTQGQAFIEALSVATGADVAASTDLTGSAALGGDWVLEASAGTVEAEAISAPDYAEVFQVRINLNGATGVGSTNFTEQTAVDLFPSAIFNPNGNDADKVDTVTVSMANPAATRTLSLNASAAATASTNSVTVGYNVATGVLTLTGSNETNTAWELILRGVQYHDSSDSPTSPGTITVTGTESGGPTVGTDTHSVVVVPVNDAPTTTPVTLTAIAEDSGPHLITQAQLLANASDPDGNPLTATNLAIAAGGGALVNNGNGTWSYTPATNDSTSVQFSYLVSDGSLSAAGSATLDITPAEDEATGTLAVTGSAQEGGSLVALLTATDADGAITTAYRWQEKIAGVWTDIAGANTGTLAIPGDQSYVGKEVRAVATSTDPVGGTTVFEGTAQVIANVEDEATGTLAVTGTAQEGGSLVAALTATDADGSITTAYRWQEKIAGVWTDIAGANTGALAIPGNQSYVGKEVRAVATSTDPFGGTTVFEGTGQTIANVNDAPVGTVTISGTATEDQTLTASNDLADEDGLGTVSYQWQADGVDIGGATGSTLTLGQAQVGKAITVVASYTDAQGTLENVESAATTAVLNVNDAPQGTVTITGTATEDQVLTASNNLADEDGLGTVSYQWQADGVDIGGATGSTLTLGQAQVGKQITVVASYTDLQGTLENVESAATTAVLNVNDAPVGTVTISGTATEDQTLTASNDLADEDGLGTVSYSWEADGVAFATGGSVTLGQAQVGKQITVVASYTDLQGTLENVESAATAAVLNVNDAPVGTVTISGTATEDQTLTASNDLADEDGLGTVSYQWQADGVDIGGATGSTLTLGQAQVGKQITVVASYTDLQGTLENVESAATAAVLNVNDAPVGTVTISGTATEDQTLTASNDLADEDGLGAVSYSWEADGVAFATGGSVTLGQAQVGKAITVVASYTDAQGTLENVTSAATAAVLNVNDAPQGTVTITGTATEDQVLTASNNLADEDGLGTVSYQWQADGVDIGGATGSTLTLGQAQVGKAITVVASYTDAQGTLENVTSAATAAVLNVNDAPQGTVTISGTATEDQTLTASNDLADEDGLGAVSYSWEADGVAFATGGSVTLDQAQVGKQITVVASYTDLQGTLENVESAATTAVLNVNDAPQGTVTITGTATEDQVLTASNNLADEDGLGTVSYQWQADGVDIGGATGSTLTLGQAQVGKQITVVASYTDLQGTLENVESAATAAVANVEDEATGTLAVTGAAQEGGSLAALLTATDADGAVTTAYRWQEKIAGVWTDIAGANTGTLAIPSDQSYVGKEVRAVATSTDPFGGTTAFEGTGQVIANVNDAPTLQAISLSTVENAAILLPIIPDHATDADGNALTLGVVTFDTMLWPSGFSLINPVTKQAVNLPDLKVQVSDVDGKSIYLTPAAELDWMASNQTITAKLKYTVTDSTGVSSTDDITLTIIGSTADKGKNLIGTNGADNLVGTTGKAEDVLQGGNGNDTLKGNDGTDALYGGNGDDKLYGDEGIDYLYGDNGNDQLFGGDAADVLFGGKGNDIYSGGAGGDHFVFESQLGADRVTDFKWSEGDKLHFVDFFSGPITAGDVVSKYAAATAGGDVVLNLQGGSIVLVGMAAGDGDWSAHLASAISFVAPT